MTIDGTAADHEPFLMLISPALTILRPVNDREHDDLFAIVVNFIDDEIWAFDQFARAGV
jgi:hypothetical protein